MRLVQTQQPFFARQQMPQNHSHSANENLAICVSARAGALCLLEEEFASRSRRRQEHQTAHSTGCKFIQLQPQGFSTQTHLTSQGMRCKLIVLIQYLHYPSLVHPPFNLPANAGENEGVNRDDVNEHDEKQAAERQKT